MSKTSWKEPVPQYIQLRLNPSTHVRREFPSMISSSATVHMTHLDPLHHQHRWPPIHTTAENLDAQYLLVHLSTADSRGIFRSTTRARTLPTRKRKPPSDSCVQRLWLCEILSITAAALALATIVIILVLHRDHPLPKWLSAITINALIAVFTAIFKACLMMPVAECIGQLKWLWYQKSRPLSHIEQWDLASRGASPRFISLLLLI